MREYPKVYHKACNYLVRFGAHGPNKAYGRHLIAQALVAIRHKFGHETARFERRCMLFISGMFPEKEES
jgi:hypothetical protein